MDLIAQTALERMMTRSRALLTALAAATVAAGGAQATQLITNGNFETGTYAGWTPNVEGGSSGSLVIQANNGGGGLGTAINPAGGNFFSLTQQGGPGSYSLTQSFTLSSAGTVHISFDMFANNYAGVVHNNGRDFNTSPNQNATADILTGSPGAFTNAPGDIVSVLYGPGADAGANPNPWTSYSSTLNLAAGTYQIRFAETDNQSFFNQGVDNVSITTGGVPEPTTWALMLMGLVGLGSVARNARRKSDFANA